MINSIGHIFESGNYYVHSIFSDVINLYKDRNAKEDDLKILYSVVSKESNIGCGPNHIVVENFTLKNISDITITDQEIIFNIAEVQKKSFCRNGIPIYNKHSLKSILNKNIGINEIIFNTQTLKKYLLNNCGDIGIIFLLNDNYESTKFSQSTFQQKTNEFFIKIKQSLASTNIDGDKKIFALEQIIKDAKGIGIGLTPSGDDFNCGVILAMQLFSFYNNNVHKNVVQNLVNLALGKNLFSNTFLYLIANDDLNEKVTNLVTLISKDNLYFEDIDPKIFQYGETSGLDFTTGFILTFNFLLQ